MDMKFGFSVQQRIKQPIEDSGEVKVKRPKKNIIEGKLIGFTSVILNDGQVYNVNLLSQSVKGLSKYFRKINDIYFVEKPENRPRFPIANCFKYRKGALVEGFMTDENEYFITGYQNV